MQSINRILTQLDELDTKSGISYCLNDKEFYLSVLNDFTLLDKKDLLFYALKTENWVDYKLLLHNLESASRTIGADLLLEEIKILEHILEVGDYDYLKKHTSRVMKLFGDTQTKIAAIIKDIPISKRTLAPPENKPHILVIDDDIIMQRILEHLFTPEYHVVFASSSDDLMEILKTLTPDIVLIDANLMPLFSNSTKETMHRVIYRAQIPTVLMVEDLCSKEDQIALPDGVTDYIKKPIEPAIAKQRVARLLKLYRLQKDLQREVLKQTKCLKERSDRIERISMQLVSSLVNAIEAKDPYTKGHSARVAKYACMIGARMGYDEDQLYQLNYIGLLHDVGKIGIPDDIIASTKALTSEEYDTIKLHPIIGANILKDVTEIPNIVLGARWHHERYNGSGYPDGLKGTDIPEVARIIGIADAYDAMTSNRKYRKDMSQEAVRKEIADGAGTQFDPEIAAIMLGIIDEDKNFLLRELPSQE